VTPICTRLHRLLSVIDGAICTAAGLPIEAMVEAAGALTAPAHLLAAFVARLTAGADIRLDARDNLLHVVSGRARAALPTLPEADWPDFARPAPVCELALPAPDVADLLAGVAFAISDEVTRYYLCGAHLEAVRDEAGAWALRAVAIDGHRLAHREIAAAAAASAWPALIVPSKAVGVIIRLARAAEGDLKLAADATRLTVEAGATRLVTKLIDGQFPDYRRIMPQGGDRRLRLDRDATLAALSRILALADDKARGVKIDADDARVTLALATGVGDGRAVSEEIEADYEGEPITIGFNGAYLREMLDAIEADTALVTLSSPGEPALFTGPDRQRLRAVLMPMRV